MCSDTLLSAVDSTGSRKARKTEESSRLKKCIRPLYSLAENEDMAFSAEKAGMNYSQFIQRLLNIGFSARGSQ